VLALKLLGHGMSGFFPMSSDLVPVYFVHKKKKIMVSGGNNCCVPDVQRHKRNGEAYIVSVLIKALLVVLKLDRLRSEGSLKWKKNMDPKCERG